MKEHQPEDAFTGAGSVGSTPAALMPYENLLQRASRWMLWVSNYGPDPVAVQWTASPDGVHADEDGSSSSLCPAGRCVTFYGDGLHRFWAISAWSTTSTPCGVSWGVVLDLT